VLDIQSYTAFDKTDPTSPNVIKYPKRALYEAMGNALAHRDYELPDPTRLTVFSDRIEVASPGSLPTGVDIESVREGTASPRWRNQSLALGDLEAARGLEGTIVDDQTVSSRRACPMSASAPSV
jgi:ATP-dependent DNA helicase RecG